MAKGNIVLDVDTKYNGEGMTKLNQAMKDTGAKAKTASRAIGEIQQALGETNTAAGKVAGAVGGVVQSFTQLGIAGGIIAAGTLAIQGLFKWLNRTNDALGELAKGFGNKVAAAVKAANAEIAKTNKLFAEMLGKQNTKTERENIVLDAGLSQMEEQKKQALAGKSGSEAAKIELEWTKKIEDYKEAQSQKHLKDVKEEIALTQQNLKAQQDAQAKAYSKFKALNEIAVDAWNNDKLDLVTKNKMSDDAQVAKKQWQAYAQPIEELQKKLESLGTKQLKAQADASLAPEKRKSALMDAEAKLAEAIKKETKEREDKANAAKKEQEQKDKEQQKLQEQLKKQEEAKQKLQKKAEADEKIAKLNEAGAKAQKELNDQIASARKSVQDWIANLNSHRNASFSDFSKAQNDAAKQVQLGVDENGNPITIDKKQANRIKSNRQNLDRLLKMKNPNKQVQDEIAKRQAFDDMFNPEKLKERREAAQKLEKEKAEAEKKMKDDIHKLKQLFVDNNGVAL